MKIGDMIDAQKDREGLPELEAMQAADKEDFPAEDAVEAVPAPRFELPAWLKAQTGPGDIEDYVTHPLNFNKSRWLARILRGLTGMFGELRYAVIDILLGAIEMSRERKKVVEVAARAHAGH